VKNQKHARGCRRFHDALVLLLLFPFLATQASAVELQKVTLKAWDEYLRLTERRIATELSDGSRFTIVDFLPAAEASSLRATLAKGDIYVRRMETKRDDGTSIDVKDGMIHHWAGGIFVPHMDLDFLLRWLQDYEHHDRYFKDVEKSHLISRDDSTFRFFYRLRRKKIITVVFNTDHAAIYQRHGATRASSRSFTTKIAEVENPGSASEHEAPVGNDGGYLWRLNSYWRFQAQDGGVIVECESVSLSRGIPAGFGWMIKSFAQTVPRESLESTLTSIRDGSLSSAGPQAGAPRQ
jgi:hypothetical protein